MTNEAVTRSGGWDVYRAVDNAVYWSPYRAVYMVVLRIVIQAVGDFEALREEPPHPGLALYLGSGA